jgi:iron complex transport system substrate-binding protein
MKYYCRMRLVIILALGWLFFGCDSKNREKQHDTGGVTTTALQYAEGFKITYQGKNKLVEVRYPFQGATSGYTYLLVPRDEPIPPHPPDVRIIFIPVRSIVCTSTTHIPLIDYLDEGDKLVGFPSTDYISSERIRKRIDAGHVQELGVDRGMNLERLAVLKPDMVMGYTMNSDYGQFKKMEELKIPVVINAEYLEKHPLGRAEWIKFMALFFNKEKEADSVFRQIERSYVETKALVDTIQSKPTVLSGIVYGDAWFLPGGQNYASKILRDAGCRYLWEEDDSHGYLELSFESVYEKAHEADIWIGVGNFSTLKDIENADHRYTQFKPFKNKSVYTYDARKGAKGGSEFLELGYLRPDIILKDLIKIAHPHQMADHELYFHRKLE